MSGQSDHLRQKAAALFGARFSDEQMEEPPPGRVVVGEIPSGGNITIRVYWNMTEEGHVELAIRGFERGPAGRDVARFGLTLRTNQLPTFAAAIAAAMDDLAVTAGGLRVKAERMPALPSGRHGR